MQQRRLMLVCVALGAKRCWSAGSRTIKAEIAQTLGSARELEAEWLRMMLMLMIILMLMLGAQRAC